MTYFIEWHPQAFRVLRKLPQPAIQRIISKLDIVIEQPFRYLEHYEGRSIYKLRIGTYRLLIDVKLQEKIMFVRLFDKRGRAYKR